MNLKELTILSATVVFFLSPSLVAGDISFAKDSFTVDGGTLEITFIGHGTLMLAYNGTIIQVDPWSQLADYSHFPKAGLILVTHEHGDHLDPLAVQACRDQGTEIVLTEACASRIPGGIVMKNGDSRETRGIRIEAVPAYNILHRRPDGNPFHPQGSGNGYLLGFGAGSFLVYIAGDTEEIPEMALLRERKIDIAFLPMNLPYTMTPEMVADAAKVIRPGILYPYHYGDTDTGELIHFLEGEKDIEVRIRNLQ